MAAEHLVPVAALPQLEREIEGIGRRYARAGAPSVRLLDTGLRAGELAVVRVVGNTARLGDWDMVCVLHHRNGHTELEALAPLSVEQRARLTQARALCEACRTVRPRKETFILRERSSGRTIQLGSNCLRPYTGAESPERCLAHTRALAETSVSLAAATTPSRRSPFAGARYIDTTVFLAHTVALVREGGYRAAVDPAPTWADALDRLEQATPPALADLRRAAEIRRWAGTHGGEPAEDYRMRLAACLQPDRLTSRELALAASAVRAYNRHLYWQIRDRARRAKRAAASGLANPAS